MTWHVTLTRRKFQIKRTFFKQTVSPKKLVRYGSRDFWVTIDETYAKIFFQPIQKHWRKGEKEEERKGILKAFCITQKHNKKNIYFYKIFLDM